MDYTKQCVAEEVKRLVRHALVDHINKQPGLEVKQVDTADNLEAHVVVKQDGYGMRSFKIKVSEVL